MKSYGRWLGPLVALCCLQVVAFAADPTGKWKWTQKDQAGGGRALSETVLELTRFNGKLTGTLAMPGRGTLSTVVDIINVSFKDDVIAFTVERDFNANKIVTRYRGKIAGDFINGTAESLGRDGLAVSRTWTAARLK